MIDHKGNPIKDMNDRLLLKRQILSDLQNGVDYQPRAIANLIQKKKDFENELNLIAQQDQSLIDLNSLLGTSEYPKIYRFKDARYLLKATSDSKTKLETKKLVQKLEKYIYGRTPICKSLRISSEVFAKNLHDQKVLFILTDGESTDGNPELLCEEMKRKQNVIIFSCLISLNKVTPKKLFDKPEVGWNQYQKQMFNMSSVVHNSLTAMSVLINNGSELPHSGESRLFAQVNHPDAIKEFCSIIDHLSETDLIAELIGHVSLDMYINQSLRKYEVPEQIGGTCFANAVASVIHLANARIVGRTLPEFKNLREEIIQEYGPNGAITKNVLEKFCPLYKLRCQEVNESKAREALTKRRPVVVTFCLYKEAWKKFSSFYQKNPKGVLEVQDIYVDNPTKDLRGQGHAVVLMGCDSNSLTFMNSWGTDWGDNGFFRIKKGDVLLHTTFYDVFWTLSDLTQGEIEAFEKDSKQKLKALIERIPINCGQLPYKCPFCEKESQIKEFKGSMFNAECPKCKKNFKPGSNDLMTNLYYRQYDAK